MKVRDVMTPTVITVAPDTPFPALVEVLLAHDIGAVPVVDRDGRLLGVVSEADLLSKEAYGSTARPALRLVTDFLRGHDPQWIRKGAGRTAAELMTARPETVGPDDDVVGVARRMLEDHRKQVPVVDAGRLVGVVARHDLLRTLGRDDTDGDADLDRLLVVRRRRPATARAATCVLEGW